MLQFIRWCGNVKLNNGSTLIVTGVHGVGKTTMMHFMKEIVSSSEPHQYCQDQGWVTSDEYDNLVFDFEAIPIILSLGDNIFDNIYNLGKPQSIRKSLGMGGNFLGFGGNVASSWENNDFSKVGQALKKIEKNPGRPMVFFIDTVGTLKRDLGSDIKYITEYARQKNIVHLNFVIAVDTENYQQSSYFSTQCNVIEVGTLGKRPLLEYANRIAEYHGISINDKKVCDFIDNNSCDINKLKSFINKFGGTINAKRT